MKEAKYTIEVKNEDIEIEPTYNLDFIPFDAV